MLRIQAIGTQIFGFYVLAQFYHFFSNRQWRFPIQRSYTFTYRALFSTAARIVKIAFVDLARGMPKQRR